MLGMHICALHGSSPAAFGRRQHAKERTPPPKRSDKHPGVRDPVNSSGWSCSTCETLAVPPAWPRLRVKGIRRRHSRYGAEKAFMGFGFCSLASLVMERRGCYLETPGEQAAIQVDRGDRERS